MTLIASESSTRPDGLGSKIPQALSSQSLRSRLFNEIWRQQGAERAATHRNFFGIFSRGAPSRPDNNPGVAQYFKDLHELIEWLLSEVEAVMHQTAHPWINGQGEPIAALLESQKGVVQTCVDHGPIFRAVAEAAPLDERLERTWSAFTGAWDDIVEARIKAQQREGLISKSLHARRIAKALNSLDTALLIAEFGRRPQGDPKAVLKTIHHIWRSTLYAEFPQKRRRTS